MTQLPNMDDLEKKTEIKVNSKDLMFQRVVSTTYLSDGYVDNVFRAVFKKLKELKTLEEILEVVEYICMEIYEKGMTFEAFDFLQRELKKIEND